MKRKRIERLWQIESRIKVQISGRQMMAIDIALRFLKIVSGSESRNQEQVLQEKKLLE